MNDYSAYKNTNHQCKKEETIRSKAGRLVTNGIVKNFLKEIEKIKVADTIMKKEEGMEILSNMSRGKITDLMALKEGITAYDDNGNPIRQNILTFDKDLLNKPEKCDIIHEYQISDDTIKVKVYNRVAAIKQLAELANWEEEEDDKDTPKTSFDLLRKRMKHGSH